MINKKLITSLFFSLLSISFLTGQIDNAYYSVQVGTFVNPEKSDFSSIIDYGYLYARNEDQKLKQVYIGGFDNEKEARNLLNKIKRKGYSDAFIAKRNLAKGKEVAVIQLASVRLGDDIDFQHLSRAGTLYTILNGQTIKIVVGKYKNKNVAKAYLERIKSLGFSDAFLKVVNSLQCHKIREFEAGGPLTEEIPQEYLAVKGISVETPPKSQPIPPSYEFTEKAVPPPPVAVPELPTIKNDIKRFSVKALQQFLKENNYYQGNIDGLYGKGTTAAVNKAKANSDLLQKYIVLADKMEPDVLPSSEVEQSIFELWDNPERSLATLRKTSTPIAKAFEAYYLFQKNEDNQKINDLMNLAIKETFVDQKVANKPPFDFNASYDYRDINQLLTHLGYIHSSTKSKTAMPCWLFQRHPEAAHQLFKAADSNIQACDSFMDWQEIKMLDAIARDLNPENSKAALRKSNSSKRAYYFLTLDKLPKDEITQLEDWDHSLWVGINKWSERDPLHIKMSKALRFTYYQAQVRLEDYFLDKGFKTWESSGLALATLKTIVGDNLVTYSN